MAKGDIFVTFQIGRNSGRFDASKTDGSKQVSKAIARKFVELGQEHMRIMVNEFTKSIKKVIEDSYTEAVRYAANNMIGRASRGTPKTNGRDSTFVVTIGGDLNQLPVANWRQLSKRQVLKQNGGKPGIGKYFLDTGHLRSYLLRFARNMVKNTGVVKVQVRGEDGVSWTNPGKTLTSIPLARSDKVVAEDGTISKKIPVSNVRLTILPNIYPSRLPGVKTGNVRDHDKSMGFETALGLSPDIVAKLRGPVIPGQPDIYHRPLLQPVFTYWTLYKIPGLIRDDLSAHLLDREA